MCLAGTVIYYRMFEHDCPFVTYNEVVDLNQTMTGSLIFETFLYYGSYLTGLHTCVKDKGMFQIKNSGVDYPFPNLRIL